MNTFDSPAFLVACIIVITNTTATTVAAAFAIVLATFSRCDVLRILHKAERCFVCVCVSVLFLSLLLLLRSYECNLPLN